MPGANSSGRVFHVVFMENNGTRRSKRCVYGSKNIVRGLIFLMKMKKPRFLAALKNVRPTGLEPVPIAGHAPQTCAYANSATVANGEATEDIIKNLPDFVKTYVRYSKYFLGRWQHPPRALPLARGGCRCMLTDAGKARRRYRYPA